MLHYVLCLHQPKSKYIHIQLLIIKSLNSSCSYLLISSSWDGDQKLIHAFVGCHIYTRLLTVVATVVGNHVSKDKICVDQEWTRVVGECCEKRRKIWEWKLSGGNAVHARFASSAAMTWRTRWSLSSRWTINWQLYWSNVWSFYFSASMIHVIINV